jgi:hypothetical protein
MHTEEKTDMAKQLVSVGNFAKASKNTHTKLYKGENKLKITDPKR